MRVSFQAIHVSWAHAFPIFSDVPVLHVLRTLFGDGNLLVFPVRMETCCRSSVVFLDRCSTPSANAQLAYRDLLCDAYQNCLFHIVPVVISPSRQMWINRTDTPYYVCPYSIIPYDQFVHYFPEIDVHQLHQEQPQVQQQQQQHQSQHQQPQQQSHHQQQQRGGPSRAHNRARRFGNNTSGGGGSHKRTQNPNTNHQNGRRSRKNGPNHNNGQQRHQQQTKKKEPIETAATTKT